MKRLVLLVLLVPALALAISDLKWFDLNHWMAPFQNDGRWGMGTSDSSGGSWPQPLRNVYVFGAGAWIGAIVDSSPPETLCTVVYNPNSGNTEGYPTLCRYWRENPDPLDRIYVHPGDWPPPLGRFPMAPQSRRSDMDLWCCFCDSNPAGHISPGRPLGIDVCLTVLGYDDSLAQDFFYLKYELANSSGDTLRQALFGVVLDADIGDGMDDMTGLILDRMFQVGEDTIRVRNTGFAYDYNNYEDSGATWQRGTPGAVAVMLLDSPESLGLTAFKKFAIEIDPVTDATQYLTLAGYDWRTGVYGPYDSVDLYPGDKRMLLATGPFNLAPDSVLTFWYAVIGSPFGDSAQPPSERDTSELALRCKWAREYFKQVTGVAEQRPTTRSVEPFATVIRRVLLLPSSLVPRPASLFDIAGRQVMALKPGANDVSRLSPGIYFVRSGPSAVSGQPSAVRKVIVTR